MSVLHSNKPIQNIISDALDKASKYFTKDEAAFKGVTDSIENTVKAFADKESKTGIIDAIKQAHHVGNNLENPLSGARIAGSIIGVGATARIATGGGLYRDKDGNTNLPVVPFI